MKTNPLLRLTCLMILVSALGCGYARDQQASAAPEMSEDQRSEQQNPVGPATVLETMNSGSYTYVYVDSAGRKTWWAAPEFQVAVGDTVSLPEFGSPMHGFTSKTLNRSFEEIYFAGSLQPISGSGGEQPGKRAGDGAISMEQAHAGIQLPSESAGTQTDFSGLTKPEGGKTVAEIFAQAKSLADQEILLRGKVVKVSPNILNYNWVHLRDGTGGQGANDLTITTKDEVRVGDTVLVRGTLVTDRDFGYGYQFAVLVEKATLTVE